VGIWQEGEGGWAPAGDEARQALEACAAARAALARKSDPAALGRTTFVPTDRGQALLLVGLGLRDSFEADALRAVAGAAGRTLAQEGVESLAVALAGACAEGGLSLDEGGEAFGEGMGIVGYSYDYFLGSVKARQRQLRTALTLVAQGALGRGVKRGLALAHSTNFARFLANTPPNHATPQWMAAQARQLARACPGLRVRVIEGAALAREQLTGLLNVGKASENPPCLVRLEWAPRGTAGQDPLVFVGKTITYDTGGLSLKPSNFMRGMKGDKAGGCAVLAAMHALARHVRPQRRVVALLACAENSVSDEAYRPDDVLRFRNGVTVEVTNTDAEGRLVLADALCWACQVERAAAVVDLATLTGGVVTALGSTYAGMWCDDETLRSRVEAAAKRSGERVWRLPLHQEHKDLLRSDIADVVNSSASRKAHPIQGAAFLSYFVEENTPWCHLDIAGVAECEQDAGPFVKGLPTGWGVRLLARLAATV